MYTPYDRYLDSNGYIYCSSECRHKGEIHYEHPTKDILQKLIWEKPTTTIAKEFNVSDVAISKLCKQYGIKKPGRGYWTKKKFDLV